MSSGATINPNIVREAIETALTDDDIEGAISDAMDLYDSYLGSKSITVRIQLKIKKFLAAHFVSLKDPSTRVNKEKIGDAEVTYTKMDHSDTFTGIMTTTWGQQAALFDPTGILRAAGNTPPKWYSLSKDGR